MAVEPEEDDATASYRDLVRAIVHRAVQDAQGHCWSPGPQTPGQIQAEARRWLAEEHELTALLELAGVDSMPVVERVRRLLSHKEDL